MRAWKVLVAVVAGEMCVRGTEWSAGARVLSAEEGSQRRNRPDLSTQPLRASGHLFFKLAWGRPQKPGNVIQRAERRRLTRRARPETHGRTGTDLSSGVRRGAAPTFLFSARDSTGKAGDPAEGPPR